jgi:cell division protein FtsN
MSHKTVTDDGRELVLDNRKLIIIFLGLLAICGCFFIVGYVIGNGAAVPPANNDELIASFAPQEQRANYADAGSGGNSRTKDNSGSEVSNRMNEIAGKPVQLPSAVIDPVPAAANTKVTDSMPPVQSEAAAGASSIEQPAVSSPPVSVDKPRPLLNEAQNNTAKAAAEKPVPAAKQTVLTGISYSVQVAAFRARREAEIKARELEDRGFEPRIELPLFADDWYRLKVGNFATRAEAASMVSRLKSNGFDTMITENKGN